MPQISGSVNEAQELPSVDIQSLLLTLNPAQLQAVQHDPSVPLQILAGPGSGKTKVLTSRIAYLILVHKIAPSSICAVTFTNKAANEMRERLTKLIGKKRTTAMQMGTFHSICVRYLRMHSAVVGLEDNFTICDADESKKLLLALLKPYNELIREHDIPVTEGNILGRISKAKAKGQSAAEYFKEMDETERSSRRTLKPNDPQSKDVKSFERIIAEVYIGYEQVLKNNNALDFDDLLIYGVKLFGTHKESVLWCRHILVDEFQDTNTMQYELMSSIGFRRCVSIVGDPDQSIYGWRSAEVTNLAKMRKDFPRTLQILLEENYRSTAAILRASLAVVAEDKKRIPKYLRTSHPLGATPHLGLYDDEKVESDFIAYEIKRCAANMGGVLKWGDFAILLRFNALSRPIESALQKQGIPCRILGGHKFFDRMEVKDVISYLQLVDNPNFNPSFVRAVKAPPRGVGEKSLEEIASQADKSKVSHLSLVEKIVDGKTPDTKPSVKKKLTSFVKTIQVLRKLNDEVTLPSELIRKLVDTIHYEEHLKKTQQDWESRWENIQELITFASEVESDFLSKKKESADVQESSESAEQSALRYFLQCSTLSSEGDNQTEDQSKEKVTISTCHAAKGLEWPVVIIPSVDRDTFPFYRTEDIDEERRLLYVGCTRAQSLLYLLHSRKRQVAGKTKAKSLSDFLAIPLGKNPGLLSWDVPRFLPADRAVICQVLNRDKPDEAEIAKRLKELELSGDFVQPTHQTPGGLMATVGLTGVKNPAIDSAMGNVNLASMYAAPDTLAAISASFMRDYNPKAPFSQTPKFYRPARPPSTPTTGEPSSYPMAPVLSSFTSASVHAAHRFSTRVTSALPGSNSNTLQQAPKLYNPSAKSQVPSHTQCGSSRTLVNTIPPHSAVMSPRPKDQSYTIPNAVASSSKDNCSRNQGASGTIGRTPANTFSSQRPTPPRYDQNRPPGGCDMSSAPSKGMGPRPSSLPTSSYDMTSMESSSSPMLVSSPPRTHNLRPPPVSDLPTLGDIRPRTYLSASLDENPPSAPPPQTTGVKRRLGMGLNRGATAYSNKKFKPLT